MTFILRALFLSVLDENRQLFTKIKKPTLCHEDLHKHNILFEYKKGGWHLSTILDFDKAWAGFHESDLARLDLWRGMMDKAFWQGYEPICKVDERYQERRAIYQLLWCFEVAWASPQHLADTQQVCIELGLPPIENFD